MEDDIYFIISQENGYYRCDSGVAEGVEGAARAGERLELKGKRVIAGIACVPQANYKRALTYCETLVNLANAGEIMNIKREFRHFARSIEF